ncbi:hypothetical protein CAI21_00635 [Alkalilimnicola ehrlichii]|uniref:hypothetical protein n=1 Tax=Alkalilimnicola ehrlichii TaxID=351052 RepID=UPI000E2EBBFE|nr:hypothetical protein [Alkalilimnicola ehrlichii]RFA31193.1 hypothetical protein CAI21_00635 [Alkalilimnicola ehrlichii]
MHPNPLRDVEVTVAVAEPALSFNGYPRAGTVGYFSSERVWIEDEAGKTVQARDNSAPSSRSFRNWFAWDELDVLYYASHLLWQTLSLPALLLRSELHTERLPPQYAYGSRWYRLLARYPETMPVLSREQTLYTDAAGLVHRLDYRSSLYGGWMGLAQLWEGHETFSGAVFPTRQTLHPYLLGGQVWRLTALVWLELNDISLTTAATKPATSAMGDQPAVP